jgi:hypothetical protein
MPLPAAGVVRLRCLPPAAFNTQRSQSVVRLDESVRAPLCEPTKLGVQMREISWFVHRPKLAISGINLEFAGSPRNIQDSPALSPHGAQLDLQVFEGS